MLDLTTFTIGNWEFTANI